MQFKEGVDRLAAFVPEIAQKIPLGTDSGLARSRGQRRHLENIGSYEILRAPPSGPGGEPLYRAKAATGQIQRFVPETDIVPAPASSIVSG